MSTREEAGLTGRTQVNGRTELPSLSQTEVLRMKQNNFLEAKNLMMVFDDILRNSTELKELEGSSHQMS